jgi:hypothetical protein
MELVFAQTTGLTTGLDAHPAMTPGNFTEGDFESMTGG